MYCDKNLMNVKNYPETMDLVLSHWYVKEGHVLYSTTVNVLFIFFHKNAFLTFLKLFLIVYIGSLRVYLPGGDTLYNYVNIMPYKVRNTRHLYCLTNFSICYYLFVTVSYFYGTPVFQTFFTRRLWIKQRSSLLIQPLWRITI